MDVAIDCIDAFEVNKEDDSKTLKTFFTESRCQNCLNPLFHQLYI